jgi:hypothetical protein
MINDRHIWEGWTVQDFIDELEPTFHQVRNNSKRFGTKSFETTEELKRWCMDNQPYYKKYIPEVVTHFKNKL